LLRQQLRETDFLARYAGDEFIIVTADISLEEARILAKRIEESIYKYSLPLGHGKEAKVGISIGIASFPRDGDSIDQLIITADQAMYSVKKMHKQTQRLILETQSLIELDENSLIA
jgi:diguanylate cyclase (GGDEF)-like protein